MRHVKLSEVKLVRLFIDVKPYTLIRDVLS